MLRLGRVRPQLNFSSSIEGQLGHRYGRTSWAGGGEEFNPHFIAGREVVHRNQEQRSLDHLIGSGSTFSQNGLCILQRLTKLFCG